MNNVGRGWTCFSRFIKPKSGGAMAPPAPPMALVLLTEINSVNAEDKAHLKGYLGKWMQYKTIIGCAIYEAILKPH